MTKIDVVSGFLGAGKTTLIKKLLKEALQDSKVVLIENEFGEIGIDGGFLKESGIEIKEMNSGCICCSLVGDFGASLKEVLATYSPERILIEPSGVGKLSDVVRAVENVAGDLDVKINSAVVVVDVTKCKMYIKNFGEFFVNQIEHAGTIILSRTDKVTPEKVEECVELLRQYNPSAAMITTPLDQLDGRSVLETIEGDDNLEGLINELLESAKARGEDEDEECCCHGHEHHHHHHDHDGDDEHEHHHGHDEEEEHEHHHGHDEEEDHDHHHHDHDEEEDHEHHHHDHDEEEDHEHHHHGHDEEEDHEHHHHDHDGEEGHDHHHHHGHHHADEVFASWGVETPSVYSREEIEGILTALDGGEYGVILRAKGMVPAPDGTWIYFDYVPEEHDIRTGAPQVTGKLCVIGSQLAEDKLAGLFGR